MKKIFNLFIILFLFFGLVGCSLTNSEEVKSQFKEEYESINGEESSSGKTYRSVSIPEDNPYVYITAEELVEKIESDETFYVYFGDKYCPWCRSVIEKATEVAIDSGIDTIYYVDIWDDDHDEVLRDTYTLEDGEVTLTNEGTDAYYELLELLSDVLDDYTLSDTDGNTIEVGEKRIYAPNFIYIEEGETISLVEGISSLQDSGYDKLTDEILEEEEIIFKDFFALGQNE